jgi:hypothetical protein
LINAEQSPIVDVEPRGSGPDRFMTRIRIVEENFFDEIRKTMELEALVLTNVSSTSMMSQ